MESTLKIVIQKSLVSGGFVRFLFVCLWLKFNSIFLSCAKNKSKKLSLTNTKETIDYLELCLKYLTTNDLYKPVSTCFSLNVYNFELNWNNMVKYDKDEIRNIVSCMFLCHRI